MKDLPIALKAVINIILFIVYVLFISIVFSFVFPLVMQVLGKEVLNPALPDNKALFDKIQIFIAIFVLLISLILRKYFYVSCKSEDEHKTIEIKTESYTAQKKEEKDKAKVQKKQEAKKQESKKADEDEDIKIYVEKEIK